MGRKEKKRSKKASQGRKTKKKGDRESRKKSAKKLRSYSESDDDTLISVSSSFNCSGEDVVKGRRSRSRARKDVKGSKKRARSSSCSSDSSSDSSVRVKKRKSSKRKFGLGRKRKDGKKYKRAVSLSSLSSDDSDYEKSRGDSKKKEKRRLYDKEDTSKRKMKRNRARSISPSSESEYERKKKKYRSPSRSSLSMRSESEREDKRKRYWSPSDSSMNRACNSSDQHVQDEIEVQKKPIRKLNSIIVVASLAEPYQNSMSNKLEVDNDIRHYEKSMRSNTVEKGEDIEEKKSATEATSAVPDNEDLESILRRKALENLKRFQGRPKTAEKSEKMETCVPGVKALPVAENADDQENTDGSDMNSSLLSKIQPTQNESEKGRGEDEVYASPSVNNKSTSFKKNVEMETGSMESAQCSEDNRVVILTADSLNPPTVTDKSANTGDKGISRHNLISQPSRLSIVKVKAQSESVLKNQGPLATCSVKDQKSSPQECINSKLMASKCSTDMSSNTQVNKVSDMTISNINKESNIVKATVPDSSSSSIPDSTAGEHVSSELKGENKEPSQFQEKTMTVTRGGELVQVSYKVYIPKKPPAANRRRLNR